jgi:hypothetical protein
MVRVSTTLRTVIKAMVPANLKIALPVKPKNNPLFSLFSEDMQASGASLLFAVLIQPFIYIHTHSGCLFSPADALPAVAQYCDLRVAPSLMFWHLDTPPCDRVFCWYFTISRSTSS